MNRRNAIGAILICGAALMLTGCMPKMTIQEMKDQMPQRPDELDRLDAFAGKWQWEGSGKMAMLDEPLEISGTSESSWAGDNWYLLGDSVMSMQHFGESKGHEAWTYDVKAKKYRSTWVDSMGMIGMGESKYDEDDDIWKMKASSYGPWGKSTMKGWLKFTTPDTMEFWWAEYSGLMKVMEMTGTGKRLE
jgi:hypothetical protein